MYDVTIRCRSDGIIELAPKLAPLAPADRLLVIGTVLLATGGLFVSGAVPAEAAGAIVASAFAGEVFLALKAALLLALRPAAQVHEVPGLARRRR